MTTKAAFTEQPVQNKPMSFHLGSPILFSEAVTAYRTGFPRMVAVEQFYLAEAFPLFKANHPQTPGKAFFCQAYTRAFFCQAVQDARPQPLSLFPHIKRMSLLFLAIGIHTEGLLGISL